MEDKVYVVDTSIAVKWFVPEAYSEQALEILRSFSEGEVELYAPSTLKIEFSNVIRKYYIKGLIGKEDVKKIIGSMSKIDLNYVDLSWGLLKQALDLALAFNLTVYDGVYLAIAKNVKGILVTADKRFYNSISKKFNAEYLGEKNG
ncbi:MAG: type II toxin-antitoxin system VapC family toxin [Candidatus Njordarchaeia archaeon]